MARSGIQYEDVRRAIDLLLQQAESPSVQKIRDVLGTGSFTTISDHLREWRTQRDENRDRPTSQDIPAPVESLVQELWRQAQESAADGLAHYRQEADRRVEEAQGAAGAARRDAEDATQRETALSDHLRQAQSRIEAYCTQIARLEAERDSARQHEAQLERQTQSVEEQLARLQADNERLGREHHATLTRKSDEFRAQLAQEEQRHEAAEARLMKLLDSARQERQASDKQQSQRLEALEKRTADLDTRFQQARHDLADEQAKHREAGWALRQAQDALKQSELKIQRMQEALDERQRALVVTEERLRDSEARLAQVPLPPFVY